MIVSLSDVRTDRAGFAAIGMLANQLQNRRNELIQIDCKNLNWMDANMASPLGGLISLYSFNGLKFTFINLKPQIVTVLSKNGFLQNSAVDVHNTTIKYTCFNLSEAIRFSEYTEQYLDTPNIPLMTDSVKDKFFEGLDEIFGNCSIHSQSPTGIHACGQIYPHKHRIVFTISDVGIGIPPLVRRQLNQDISDETSIHLAMQEGFTTRSLDVPGGLGLKIVKQFVEKNGGKLIVVSQNGYWELSANGLTTSPILYPYPGTSVSIEIRTDDLNVYDVDEHIDLQSLF